MTLAAVCTHGLLFPVLAIGIDRLIVGHVVDDFVMCAHMQSMHYALLLERKIALGPVAPTLSEWVTSGQVVYAEYIPATGPALRALNPASHLVFRRSSRFGEHADGVYYTELPVNSADQRPLGSLRLGFDEHPVTELIAEVYRRGALLFVGYLAVALLLAWGFGRALGGAIGVLRDSARRIASGTSREPLVTTSTITEVSNLAHDLELMRQELVRRGAMLQKLAYSDGLTGLDNRRLFNKLLASSLELACRQNTRLAVLYLDLDRFKRVNDTLGHGAGDQLLRGVAARLKDCVRKSDRMAGPDTGDAYESIARLGGDEFTILLSGVNGPEDAGRVASRILDALREPFVVGGQEVFATTSIGIALHPLDGEDPDTLLKNADTAMYHAKQQGANCFRYYADSMNRAAMERLEMEAALHRAVEHNELTLHYQPQVETLTGRIIGAEALIRWTHPGRGPVPPRDLISIAEESSLIVLIGEWVIRQACAQLHTWREAGLGPHPISVNVSAKQFQHPSLVPTVAKAMQDFSIRSGELVLEITETVLMTHGAEALQRLCELRSLGVGLVIDDFGAGYSSLGYLRQFAVDALKIDRSFLQGIPSDPNNVAIVEAVIALAEKLHLAVIAEGVETQGQWEFLAEHRCHGIQGYVISPALAVDAFSDFSANCVAAPAVRYPTTSVLSLRGWRNECPASNDQSATQAV